MPAEITWNDRHYFPGEIDDLVGHDVDYIHIEQLDDRTIWMCIGNKNFHFYVLNKRLVFKHSWDNPTDEEADE